MEKLHTHNGSVMGRRCPVLAQEQDVTISQGMKEDRGTNIKSQGNQKDKSPVSKGREIASMKTKASPKQDLVHKS